jgi:hypothetical protein
MIFAVYADVGAGLAFLLLLALSSVGLAVVLLQVLLKPGKLRGPKPYLVAIGLLQAWPVYFWARFDASEVSRSVLEWAWFTSLGVAVASLVAYAVWHG